MITVFFLLAAHPGPEVRTEPRGLSERHALHRADVVEDVRYELGFSIDAESPEMSGTSVIHFTMLRPAPLTVDFDGGTVVSLVVNGEVHPAKYGGRYLEIPADALQAGENVVAIDFRHPYSADGIGLTRWKDPEDGRIYLFTDFEPYLANTLFPCFDQPDLKATYQITVEAPASWKVITGAREGEIREVGAKRIWVFQPTRRFSTYLFSLHAGEYQVWEATAAAIPLRLFARQSLAKYVDAEEWFDVTRRGLEFFGAEFGVAYPFDKYDQIIPPAMNYGAMENVGAVTFSEEYVFRTTPTLDRREARARVILHEMAHMWFGNLVTMRWWDDLWLNESFATQLAAVAVGRATDFKKTRLNFQAETKTWAYWEDQLITTHPIEAKVTNTEDAFANFDGITYGKGASALAQISFALSEDKFREGVRLYFARHAFQNADRRDFVEALEEAAGQSLSAWTAEWLQTAGLNTLKPELRCEGDRIASLELIQTAPPEHPQLRAHRMQLALFGADVAHPEVIDVSYAGERTAVPAAAGKPCPRFVLPNYGDHDYVKLSLDERSLAAVREDLTKIPDPLVRALLWQSLWEMVRDASLSAPDYLELVRLHLPAEQESVVLSSVLTTIEGGDGDGGALLAYLPAGSPLIEEVSRFLRAEVERAPKGSDLRRIWFDAWVACAGRSHARELAKLLEKKEAFGLEIDQDRRWAIMARASALGVPMRAAAKRDSVRDRSDLGRRAALAVEAAAPDEASKRRLLAQLTTLPMADAQVVILNLFPLGQEELHEKLLGGSFFASLVALAKSKDSEFLSRYVDLIPATCSQQSIARLQGELFKNDLPDLLERSMAVALQEDQRCFAIRSATEARSAPSAIAR